MIIEALLLIGLIGSSSPLHSSENAESLTQISEISIEDNKMYNSDGTFYDTYKLSYPITDIGNKLKNECTDYIWKDDKENTGLTNDITGNIPIEMQSRSFPKEEVLKGIEDSGVQFNNYGGCGPIAAMGVLHYFSSYLGYDQIGDTTLSKNRVELASTVLKNMKTFTFFDPDKNVFTYPNDYADGFNTILKEFGIENVWCYSNWTLSKSQDIAEHYLNEIKECVDRGFPSTVFIGLNAGRGTFGGHYFNVYGYETWIGVSEKTGKKITKTFLKARLNTNREGDYYCDSQILATGMIGYACYNIKFNTKLQANASDFSEYFVNSDGGGQYFFKEKECTVNISGNNIETKRLRCSYIENKYLVLSPNREDAGEAYLELDFHKNVQQLIFKTSLWGSKEGETLERFKIQVKRHGSFCDYVELDLSLFSANKSFMKSFNVLFPRNTTAIRFFAFSKKPLSDRNKGRICLDELVFKDYR